MEFQTSVGYKRVETWNLFMKEIYWYEVRFTAELHHCVWKYKHLRKWMRKIEDRTELFHFQVPLNHFFLYNKLRILYME